MSICWSQQWTHNLCITNNESFPLFYPLQVCLLKIQDVLKIAKTLKCATLYKSHTWTNLLDEWNFRRAINGTLWDHFRSKAKACTESHMPDFEIEMFYLWINTFLSSLTFNTRPVWWEFLHLCMVLWRDYRAPSIGHSWFQRHHTYHQPYHYAMYKGR